MLKKKDSTKIYVVMCSIFSDVVWHSLTMNSGKLPRGRPFIVSNILINRFQTDKSNPTLEIIRYLATKNVSSM